LQGVKEQLQDRDKQDTLIEEPDEVIEEFEAEKEMDIELKQESDKESKNIEDSMKNENKMYDFKKNVGFLMKKLATNKSETKTDVDTMALTHNKRMNPFDST